MAVCKLGVVLVYLDLDLWMSQEIRLARLVFCSMRSLLRSSYHLGSWFLWLFLRPLVTWKIRSFKSKIAITCDRDDGGGAQVHGRISTLAFARAVGLQFFHTPMTRVHFARGESDIDKWNNVIRFDQIAPLVPAEMVIQVVPSLPSLIFRLFFLSQHNQPLCYEIAHCHGFTDRFPETISDLIPELKLHVGTPLIRERVGCSDSIIHVRGEIGGVSKESPRRSTLESIKLKISKSLKVAGDSGVVIFTSEFSAELESLEAEGVHFDYQSDVFTALNCMVQAQYLYLAKSSLSYVAGILSSGTVYYEAFWHPKLKHWENFSA